MYFQLVDSLDITGDNVTVLQKMTYHWQNSETENKVRAERPMWLRLWGMKKMDSEDTFDYDWELHSDGAANCL